MSNGTVKRRKQITARDNKGRFAKGVSGNPGGVPRPTLEIRAAVRNIHDPEKSVQFLESIWQDDEQPVEKRLAALAMLWDRGWGKATQVSEISGPGGGPIQQEVDQVDTQTLVLLRTKLGQVKRELEEGAENDRR